MAKGVDAMSMYIVTQGKRSIRVLAASMCDAICLAMAHLQHARGGITARKAGAA